MVFSLHHDFSLRCATPASEMWPLAADSGDQTASVPEVGATPASAGRRAGPWKPAASRRTRRVFVGPFLETTVRRHAASLLPAAVLLRQGYCTGAASVVWPPEREAQPM